MSDPADETVVVPESPTAPTQPVEVAATPQPSAAAAPGPRTKPAPREGRARSRQARVVVRKVAPWSVLRVSFLFYLCVMVVIIGAFVILYGVLGAIGALDSLTRLIRDLFADQSFEIHGDWLFTRGLAIGFAMVVLWTLINLFIAFLYNLLSDIVGGIEVTLSERRK
ncbi:MAG TPA: DUF3566 domain-containing protein [Actinomycetota bacterium]|jgi:hypothetical protein